VIHKYTLGGINIVLDINSGGVHIFDELTFAILDYIQPPLSENCPDNVIEDLKSDYLVEDILNAYNELYELYKSYSLFSSDDYRQFAADDAVLNAPVKAMCLHVAHDCNLRCSYCFASTGDFGGGRKIMDLETGKLAIDYLLENSGNRRNLELDFFGGEPLMNFNVVKEIVKYAREKEKAYGKNFRFTITTNGVLLSDDKIEFINREMSNVVLSIDGRKSVNDRIRKRPDGGGSYDIIMKKFKKIVKLRGDKEYYVRGTFTKYNLDFANDVLHLFDEGFDQISIEPAVCDEKMDWAITPDDLPTISAEYERLASEILRIRGEGKRINFFHFMIDLEQGPCAIKRLRGCGCGNEYVAVTPEGDIYPCHQFVGMKEWKMGNLDSGILDNKMKKYFAAANLYKKEGCSDCWAKFYCSGGCNANNQIYAGDVLKPYSLSCEMQKKRIECAIMVKAAMALNEQDGN